MPSVPPQSSAPSSFYFIALGALSAEMAAVCLVGIHDKLLLAVGLHICAIALIGQRVYFNRQKNRNERFGVFLLPLTIAAGPFGILIGLIVALTYAFCSAKTQTPTEWIEDLFENETDYERVRLYEYTAPSLDDLEEAEKVEPFSDVLVGGTVLQRQMVAAKIARYFRPQFGPLLLLATNDRNPTVRVQAATTLVKIKRDFMARHIKVESELKSLPDNDPDKLKLAELYDDYAYTDLLDDSKRQSLRAKAIDIYKACLSHSDDPEWRIRLGRLYLRQDQPEEARQWLAPLIEGPQVSQSAVSWYMEALFRLKQFEELHTFAEGVLPRLKDSANDNLFSDRFFGMFDVWQSSAANAIEGGRK